MRTTISILMMLTLCNIATAGESDFISVTRNGGYVDASMSLSKIDTMASKIKKEVIEDVRLNCAGELDFIKLDHELVLNMSNAKNNLVVRAEAICNQITSH